jgi:hypothetical protein
LVLAGPGLGKLAGGEVAVGAVGSVGVVVMRVIASSGSWRSVIRRLAGRVG